jgi:predicted transcriptional regulator
VNARYSPEYRITKEELEWLGERVSELQRLVQVVCERRRDGAEAPAFDGGA